MYLSLIITSSIHLHDTISQSLSICFNILASLHTRAHSLGSSLPQKEGIPTSSQRMNTSVISVGTNAYLLCAPAQVGNASIIGPHAPDLSARQASTAVRIGCTLSGRRYHCGSVSHVFFRSRVRCAVARVPSVVFAPILHRRPSSKALL
jgi:hypothetical protein